MQELAGDFWNIDADWKVIPTNGIQYHAKAVMGAGLALDAKIKYPGIEMMLGMHLLTHGNIPGLLGYHDNIWWFSFPTKDHWQTPSSLPLIRKSALRLRQMWVKASDQSNIDPNRDSDIKVVLPLVGCGNGGLNWDKDVRQMMESILPEWNFVFVRRN